MQSTNVSSREPIAIIGIGCRFPGGAASPEQFWQLLAQGVDAIRPVPPGRWDAAQYADTIPNHGGFVDQVDGFDAPFFHIAPKEAALLDPQQRLLLEVTWEALEHAGISPHQLRGSDTGIFVGIFSNDYQLLQIKQQDDPHFYRSTGSSAATASGRIAYFLGLHGPAMSVDTASSSSLVAFHQAIMSLQAGESEMALAAGVNLILAPDQSIAFARAGMLAADGRSRGYDASASGYGRGEGCGVVVLKRLSAAVRDSDRVLAIVRGTAVNQDGASQGLTVPSGPSQEALMRKALAVAGLHPYDVDYIEGHGSGTPVGDPIEANAMQAVYGAGRQAPWLLGSVKSNIGHLEAASGIAGLIKTVLMLQHRYIPPHLHFRQLNPAMGALQATIPIQGQPWTNGRGPRRAAVSSFGFSGTNAHVILEEAPYTLPVADDAEPAAEQRLFSLVPLSAHDEQALHTLAQRYLAYLAENPTASLADLAYTTQIGRAHFSHRLAAVAVTPAELGEQLQAFVDGEPAPGLAYGDRTAGRPHVAFLFTGGGAQYVNMGRELYATEPVFRQVIDECEAILQSEFGRSLLAVLYPDLHCDHALETHAGGTELPEEAQSQSAIDEMANMQPALFAIEVALARLWEARGIQPDIVMGHSAGEYAAACLAGVFSLGDGLRLIATRGRLMGMTPMGAMFAVEADEATVGAAVTPYLDQVSVGVINGARSLVISGNEEAIEAVLASLPGVNATRLNITCASHSPLMDPILDEFEEAVRRVTFSRPQVPFVSNLTGTLEDELITTPAYWRQHLRATVRFADGVQTLQSQGTTIFVEVGPRTTLLGMARQCLDSHTAAATLFLPSLRAGQSDCRQMLDSLAELYVRGCTVDWSALAQANPTPTQRLALPTYPFQHRSYWLTAGEPRVAPTPQLSFQPTEYGVQSPVRPAVTNLLEQLVQVPVDQRLPLVTSFVHKQVRQVLGLRNDQAVQPNWPLKELGLDSLMATDLKNRLERECKVIIPPDQILRVGASIQSISELIFNRLPAADGTSPDGQAAAPVLAAPPAQATADVEDFTAAAEEVPQIHAIVTEQIGRKVKVEDRWVFDFASCNYLGIDLEPEIMDAIPPALQKWGVHPSWTRAVASPGIYEDLEQALAELVGAPMTLVFPAVTLLHAGVLPVLAGPDGVIFKDISAHRSIIEACRLAQTNGAEYLDFRHNDPVDLEAKLARYPYERTKIIAIDGVYSMSGEYPPLPEFARLAAKYNAWVYMDDAHGIGVIGENPSPDMPYGHKGNGIVRYFGLDYVKDRLIYVAGLSKSFSSFGAFITCHDLKMKNLFRSASTFIFSGPSPVASLASAIAGIELNQREGEKWRAQVYSLSHRLIHGARALGYEVINDNYFPIVCVVIGKTPDVVEACKILWEYGILITPALYPIVPKDKGLLRFSITAANTEEEIDRSLAALAAVRERLLSPAAIIDSGVSSD